MAGTVWVLTVVTGEGHVYGVTTIRASEHRGAFNCAIETFTQLFGRDVASDVNNTRFIVSGNITTWDFTSDDVVIKATLIKV